MNSVFSYIFVITLFGSLAVWAFSGLFTCVAQDVKDYKAGKAVHIDFLSVVIVLGDVVLGGYCGAVAITYIVYFVKFLLEKGGLL